jgi:hypothetical protein
MQQAINNCSLSLSGVLTTSHPYYERALPNLEIMWLYLQYTYVVGDNLQSTEAGIIVSVSESLTNL